MKLATSPDGSQSLAHTDAVSALADLETRAHAGLAPEKAAAH
jgi:hypothetical protein